jgi:pimeloyl-ACP methyl ester carboxylesterase
VSAPSRGFAPINNALIHYELAGDGGGLVMLHAGVADSRQWTHELAHFQSRYRVLRYDMRGYGQSEPVVGEFSHLADLAAILDFVEMTGPLVLMGCSMGGGLAMDFVLAYPERVKALILVGAGPSGLKLDVPRPPKADEVDKAFDAGDLDLAAELETQLWFDGGRSSTDIDPSARRLVYEMNRRGIELAERKLGKQLPNAASPAAGRLGELTAPVLIVVGSHDTTYILGAADFMAAHLPSSRKVTIANAAHLPNLDRPDEFRRIVSEFLEEVGG